MVEVGAHVAQNFPSYQELVACPIWFGETKNSLFAVTFKSIASWS